MTTLPILRGHDRAKPIGYIEAVGGCTLRVRFTDEVEITREMFFEIFGGAGLRISRYKVNAAGNMCIQEGEIIEFSLNPDCAKMQAPLTGEST